MTVNLSNRIKNYEAKPYPIRLNRFKQNEASECNVSFRRGLAWTIAGQGSFFVIQFVGSVIIARLLSPYELGVYALALSITGVLNLIQSIGMSSYIVREPDLTADRVATAFTVNALISLALAAITACLALAGSILFKEASIRGVLFVLSATPIIGAVSIVPFAMLEREANFRLIAVAGVARNLIATIGTIALALAGWSYYAIAFGQVGASLTQSIIICVVARRHVSIRLSLRNWREVAAFGSQMIAITGVNDLASRASDFILGEFSGLSALGLYNIHGIMGRVAFAEMARLKRENTSLREFYTNVVEITTAVLWPIFGGLAVLSQPLIRLVYGHKWVDAALPFALLNIAALILTAVTITWEVFVACGETARQARFEFLRTLVVTGFFIVGCSISLQAAAAARIAAAVFTILLYRPHVERMTDTSLRDTAPIYLRSAFLTVLAVGPSIILTQRTSPDSITVAEITLTVLIGVFFWVCALAQLRHPLFKEARSFITRSLQSRKNTASKV
jgi:O-antigen/teichoic acid export membrane protein